LRHYEFKSALAVSPRLISLDSFHCILRDDLSARLVRRQEFRRIAIGGQAFQKNRLEGSRQVGPLAVGASNPEKV